MSPKEPSTYFKNSSLCLRLFDLMQREQGLVVPWCKGSNIMTPSRVREERAGGGALCGLCPSHNRTPKFLLGDFYANRLMRVHAGFQANQEIQSFSKKHFYPFSFSLVHSFCFSLTRAKYFIFIFRENTTKENENSLITYLKRNNIQFFISIIGLQVLVLNDYEVHS